MLIYNPLKILLEVGFIKIYSWGFLFVLGIILAWILAVKLSKKQKIKTIHIHIGTLIALITTILGSRILYILFNLKEFNNFLKIFKIWDGGMIFYGGFILALSSWFIYFKINNINLSKIFDITGLSLLLAGSLTRIGCFLNWCCYGIQSNLPWAVKVGNDIARHPTQLYSAFFLFLSFMILYQIYKRNPSPGIISGIIFLLYGSFRFLIEFIRYYPQQYYILNLTVSQLISIGLIIIGLIILFYKKYHKK